MKRTLAKTMRSGLALLIVSCLLFGMCGTVLAAEEAVHENCGACAVKAAIKEAANKLNDLALEYGPEVFDGAYDFCSNAFVEVVDAAQELAKALKENGLPTDKLEKAAAKLKGVVDSTSREDVKKALDEVQAAVDELEEDVKGNEELMALYKDLKVKLANAITLFWQAYEDATSADYITSGDSLYVAIGDGTAYGSASYVAKVADELNVEFENLAEDGLAIADSLAVVDENAAVIAEADLVTVGFGNNTFVEKALESLVFGDDLNWEQYVGETGAAAVREALAELQAAFDKVDLEISVGGIAATSEALTAAVAAYTYSCVSYGFELPHVIEHIRDVNDEAIIVIVSMYNPLNDISVVVNDHEMPLNVLIEALVETTGLYSLTYAMLNCDVIFVEAEGVETENTDAEMSLSELLTAYMKGHMNPSDDGHEYIKDCIIDALRGARWGDVNHDGYVNSIDAMLVLRYYVGDITAKQLDLRVADVSGDGYYNSVDAMLILRHYVGDIAKFPVE